jgi:hypothetical protein
LHALLGVVISVSMRDIGWCSPDSLEAVRQGMA